MHAIFHVIRGLGNSGFILFLLLAIFGSQKIHAQCDTEVSGILAYCHSFKGNSNNIIPGYFIGFRILSLDGDTLNVVDLAGNVPMNLGKRINDINAQQEPADTSRVPVRIAGGIDSLEFWYFGPFMDGDSFNIVLVDPTGQCDTVFVAAGTFTCAGQDPLACENDVPLYVLDFSESDWQIGGNGGGNENVDDVFLVMSRERKAACCFTNNERCFEFIIKLDEDDNGILIDDVGNGSPGGKIYADSLNGFTCGPTTDITWPYFQDNGNSSDVEPLCLFASAREWIVLTCKPGANITSASIGTVGETNVFPEFLFSECSVTMEVLNASSAVWSSPDDPNLDNLGNFLNNNLSTEFLYDTAVFGHITSCAGDTFHYYVGGVPLENSCFNTDTLIYDTTYVVVYPDFDVLIDTSCYTVDSLILTANITSWAEGCLYDFNWSTGDTTQTITVPNIPGDYHVTVIRSDLEDNVIRCSVESDTVRVEIMSFECVGEPALYFDCIAEPPPPNPGVITVGGCFSDPLFYSFDVSNNGLGCPGDSLIITRYYIVDYDRDTMLTTGDRDTCIQLFIYVDDVPPMLIGCPADITIDCNSSTLMQDTGGPPTATDNCDSMPVITFEEILSPGSCPQEGFITRIWTATDDCGNSATCSQTISIEDNIPPSVSCPPDTMIICNANSLPSALGMATAIDDCDLSPDITFSDQVLSIECPVVLLRTWIATDDCGNSNTCLQTIQMIDTISPVMICPVDITILCDESTLPVNTGTAEVSDNCDPEVDIYFDDTEIAGSCLQEMVITRTWVATDVCGNIDTCIQVITIVDTIAPDLSCAVDITIECTDSTLPSFTGTSTALDNCDLMPVVMYSDSAFIGSCPQESFIHRRWSATDACGNVGTCIQVIAIEDRTPPEVICPPDLTLSCTASTHPDSTGTGTATDNCGMVSGLTYSDSILPLPSCPQEYRITRTWQATDECGNIGTCEQIIIIDDNTPPSIFCPGNITIECTANTLPVNTGSATGTDNCDTLVTVTYSDIILNGLCPQENVIQRTWRAEDDCGNSSTCLQTIIVQDTTKPVIVCASDTIIDCTESSHPDNTGYSLSNDNCDVLVEVTYADEISPGDCPQEFEIVRTWLATDDCGNINSCIQSIIVQDTTRPVIVCPSDTLINCTELTAPSNTGEATASDNCDSNVDISYIENIIPGECPQSDTLIRTWLATDDCGNTNSCVQIVIVQDTTRPVILCPVDTIIDCTEITLPSNTGSALSTDNCDAEVIITYEDEVIPGSCPYEMTIFRTWMAEDDCGNASMCVQVITTQDTVIPMIQCPPNVTITFPANTLPEATGFATGSDNCDPEVIITYLDSISSEACPINNVIIRTWIATDECNNTSTCIQYILIEDHGSICGKVEDDLGSPLGNVIIHLYADNNTNLILDAGDTLVTTATSGAGTGLYCFTDVNPCYYILVEEQPFTYGELFDFDFTPDPDGNDSLDGPDNEIPVLLEQVETDGDNNFIDIACPTILPVIPPDTICDGESVVFETTPLNPGPLNYSWDFGSGSTPTSGTGLGPHNVSFVTTTENQTDGAVITLTVSKEGCPDLTGQVSSVDINPYPDPAINGSVSNLCYFTNRTFAPVAAEIPGATYTWTFGSNAIPATATGYGPHIVYYTIAGTKTVKLVIEPNEAGAQCPDSSTIMFNVINCPGNITGTVRSDEGIGIPGVNLRLYADVNQDGIADNATIIRSVNTVLSGAFSMVGLTPGDYVIIETQPSLWFSIDDGDISPDGDNAANIDSLDNLIPATVRPSTVDAGNIFIEAALPGVISGAVFVDVDNNQIPGPGEGLPDVVVGLYADDNKDGAPDSIDPLDTVWTSSTGSYSFTSVDVGNYVVIETQPTDFTSVIDIDASADPDSVDNTNMLDDIIPVSVTNNEHDESNYFIEENECVLVVFNLDDAGAGSLREAIDCAGSGETITFSPSLAGDTIRITSDRITIAQNIIIHSTISPPIVVMSEIEGLFDIANLVNVEMKDFTIVSGIDGHEGAAIFNFGNLTLHNMNIFRNPSLTPGQYLIKNVNNGQLILSGNCFIMAD